MKTRLLLFALLSAPILHAQWTPLPMPEGGDVQFLGTAHNRVWTECSARNYFSDDQGLNWQPWTLPGSVGANRIWISDADLMTIARYPANTPEGYEDAILRSADNGDSWQAIFYDTLHQFQIGQVFSAGDYLFFVDGGGWNDSLYRSSDLGASWQYMNGGIGAEFFQSRFTAGGNVLYAEYYKDDGVCGYYFIQIRSVDFGQTWQSLTAGGSTTYISGKHWILWEYDSPSIYFSNDAGATFSTVPRSSCRDQYFYAPPYSLYAYDRYSVGCIQIWDNGAHAWQAITTPPTKFFHFLQTEAGSLLVGMHGKGGVWRAPNDSAAWLEANHGIPSLGVKNLVFHKNKFFLLNETGLHSSADNGQTWVDCSPPGSVFDLDFWGDTLLATGDNKVLFSTDEGENWNTLFQSQPVFGSIQTSGDSMFWMVESFDRRTIYYSPDRGDTWHIIAPPLALAGAFLLDYLVYQGRIWACMDTDQVFYSDDGGQTWVLNGVLVHQGSFFHQDRHFFLYGAQFYYSVDAGESWLPSSGLPPGKLVSGITKDDNNRWFVLVKDVGIFVSDDFGANWSFFDNPGSPEILSLYTQGDSLYAARNAAGLWRRSAISTSVIIPEATDSALILVPNPAQHSVEVIWPADTPPQTPLFVYDLYGKLILQTENGNSSLVKLDISTWPSGFYFVKAGRHVSRLVKN